MEQRFILITSNSMVPKAFVAKKYKQKTKENPKAAGKQKLSSRTVQRPAIRVHIAIAT